MKEDFLHYIWLYKKLDITHLFTSKKEKIEILNFGQYLQTAGPDFFNAQIIIGNQKWAGNIEIHLKSSDWYLHHHQNDTNYDNVILHVVWEHDVDIYRKDNSEIPVLELKNYVALCEVNKYNNLMHSKSWINCENQIGDIDNFVFINFKERLFFERVERKALFINDLLEKTNNDWDKVLFCLLAKNFGLNTNGEVFFKIAQAIPFAVIRKESHNVENMEAIFFGMANLLEGMYEDTYFQELKRNWIYLRQKYELEKVIYEPLHFFKLRPDNFPTIRLSQLANLYVNVEHIFEKIVQLEDVSNLYKILTVPTSKYWDSHYNFDKESKFKKKQISKNFIDLILINTIIPLQFSHSKYLGKESSETIIQLIKQVNPEKNGIIEKFKKFKVHAKDAYDSQSLLQLKNEFCNKNRCLQCHIGVHLIKN